MRVLCIVVAATACTNSPCASTAADLTHVSEDQAEVVPVQNGTQMTVRGTLSAEAPEAWFTYSASVGLLQSIDPAVTVNQPNLELCVYSRCNFQNTCPGSTTLVTGANGYRGCCGATPTGFVIGCTNSETDVWMSVTSPDAEAGVAKACESYELFYKF